MLRLGTSRFSIRCSPRVPNDHHQSPSTSITNKPQRKSSANPKTRTKETMKSTATATLSLILLFLTPLVAALKTDLGASATATATAAADKLSAYEVLKGYNFPAGLLPQGVTGYDLDPITGKFRAYLDGTCSFTIQGYPLKYKSTITGNISKGKLTNLQGVSVRILLLWINIIEVRNRDGELQFSVGIASADFPIDNFDECPRCGCGFDCVDLLVEKEGNATSSNPFVLSS